MDQARDVSADVAIVGAGPAGAITALVLARRGLRVALIDKARFPRDKVCGDFVGPQAIRELTELGLEDAVATPPGNRIPSGSVFVEGRRTMQRPLPKIDGLPEYGVVIPREIFDEALFRAACAAGATPFENHSFVDYRADADAVALRLRTSDGERVVRARYLIGADGSASLVALRLRGRPQPNADRLIAMRAYYEGVAGPADAVDVNFSSALFPGYLWVFPTGLGRANVGLGIVPQTISPQKAHLRDLFNAALERDLGVRERLAGAKAVTKLAGWPLSTCNPGLPVARGRVFLIGDAAGFINPINGEGIQYAIASGRWVAETIADALEGGDVRAAANDSFTNSNGASKCDPARTYAVRVQREIGLDMALSRLIVQTITNRSLNRAWMELVRTFSERGTQDPPYADVAASVVAGLLPTRRLFDRATRRKSFAVVCESVSHASIAGAAQVLCETVRAVAKEPIATARWLLTIGNASFQVAAALRRSAA